MRILYGISGEGMGHSTRSAVIIEELQKDNQMRIVSSGRPYEYLKKKFSDVEKVGGFFLVYRDNALKRRLTLFHNLVRMGSTFFHNLKFIRIIFKFRPQIIITDFEPFTAMLGFILRKPVISIDNQYIVKTKIEFKKEMNKLDWFIVRFVLALVVPFAKHYIVTTFFYPENKKKNVTLVPPIIRKEIIKAKRKEKDYVLVYQTSPSNKKLLEDLKKINEKFIVYGFHMNKKDKNLIFREFSEKQIVKDMAECKAVITNGGFTLMSEALYLKKPILSEPVRKQMEQYINAKYLEKLGYGKYCEKADEKVIREFLANLEFYKKNLKKMKGNGNKKAVTLMRKLIKKYTR